ncbi:MAG: HIT family protein [Candidatus Binatia bacterium]
MDTDPANCVFCHAEDRELFGNSLAFATRDGMPATKGHTLVIPRRHCLDFFSLSPEEATAMFELICRVRKDLDRQDPPPDGYNVGVNVGVAGGQGVAHIHVHIIPRYHGDVPNPRGGIRNIVRCDLPMHNHA